MTQMIKIIPATIADYETIQNMARFYVYDRTKYIGWECPANGMFECIDFMHYLENPTSRAYLVKLNNELVGFVLLDKVQLIEPVDWNMGEFFILAKFQNKGIGAHLAREIFKAHQGQWSVAVMAKNIAAVHFWRKIISDMSNKNFAEVFSSKEELKTRDNLEPDDITILLFDTRNTVY